MIEESRERDAFYSRDAFYAPSTSPAIITPPRSPLTSDPFCGFDDPTFGLVDPNAVLDCSYSFLNMGNNEQSLNGKIKEEDFAFSNTEESSFPSGEEAKFPKLNCNEESVLVKNEDCCYGLLADDDDDDVMSLELPRCFHGVSGLCNECLGDTFKNEILSDSFWTEITSNEKEDDKLPDEDISLRSRLDSVSSRYSEIFPPLTGTLATPSDTSDTDTDMEESKPYANVHMDHNYHFTSNRSKDISSPLRKALNQVSGKQVRRQQVEQEDDSDEEITIDDDDMDVIPDDEFDVVEIPAKYTLPLGVRVLNRNASVISTSSTISAEPVRVPGKRGRKPGSTNGQPRKVGRPPKNAKRLNEPSGPSRRPAAKRPGGRAIQMDPEKRAAHNTMERQRRVNLKCDFENMCELVPSLQVQNDSKKKFPAKVNILRHAAEYVMQLEKGVRNMESELMTLTRHNGVLVLKLDRLKRERGITTIECG